MIRLKSNFILNLLIILSFCLLSILSSILLLKNNILYTGMDTQFHIRRIMEIKSSIDNNFMLSDFSFNYFHGSSVMNLYPYLNLLPAIIVSYIIKNPIIYIYSLFIINTLLTFVISFYSIKRYIGIYSTSYIFSIIYSLSNLLLMHNIITEDLGIVYSYMFLPLVVFGFLQIIRGKYGCVELSIGLSLMLYSHIINSLFIVMFLIILLIFNVKKLNINNITTLFKSFFLFLTISAIFWLPFLHLYFDNIGNINMPINYQLDKVPIKNFISGIYGSKSNSSIGFFPLIALFITPIFYKKIDKYDKQLYILSLLLIILVLFFPWKFITSYTIFKFLNQIQFTFRLLFIPQMLLSYIFSILISQYIQCSLAKKYISYILIILIAVCIQIGGQYSIINSFYNNPPFQINKNSDNPITMSYKIKNNKQFYYFINNTHYRADDDYIPKSSLKILTYVNKNLGLYNDYYPIKVKHTKFNTFIFSSKHNINKISLPIYLYNKERLHVYLNNKSVKNYDNEKGLITINNIHKNIQPNNKVYVKPYIDPFRITGAILSIFGWLFSLITFLKKK